MSYNILALERAYLIEESDKAALHLAKDPQLRFKVYATMRNQSTRQDDLKAKAGSSLDDTLFIRELDVTKQETIDKTVKEIVEREGRIHVLGIGQEIALHLAKDPQRRFKVYATMRNQSTRQDDLKAKAGSSLDDTLFIRELDVTKQETIDKTVKEIVDSEGRIDVLVNNAGVVTPLWWETASMESFYDIMEVNYFGCVRMIKAVVPYMKEKRSGRILQLSSTIGLKAIPVLAQYTGSKRALQGFSESITPPLRKFNVWVSVIQPGFVITEMTKHFGSDPTALFKAITTEIPEDTREIVAKMLTTNPDDVMGTETQTTDDFAKVVEEIILSEKPHFWYQSYKSIQKIARQVFVDPTGNAMIDTWLKQ
ncbi:retinol dehydrogenase 8-like [Amphiura filiformis]|uniref:retinol dehydrogenase 8-like n=1 Tax=Amphiura filiformis TaxID=82378 RepID=UPI003B220ADC